jgi:hypothetical protein
MKRTLLSTLLAVLAVAGTLGAWIARGVYDRATMDQGVFRVINANATQRTVVLLFPSGERREAVVPAGMSADFHVANTGEGAVTVQSDGENLGSIGYVTSMNDLSILVIHPDGVLVSEYSRSQEILR